MKKGCLIALGASALLLLVAIGALIYVVAKYRSPGVAKGSYVEIRIGGTIPENVSETYLVGDEPTTMRELSDLLHWAAEESRVQGIVLRIEPLAIGWAKLAELRDQAEAVKTKGKSVVAFLESGEDAEYFLASVADKVFMPPMGTLGLDGLSAELDFYRGLLDKVGVAYDGVAIGEFKSAPEHFTRERMSDHYREEYDALLDGVLASLVDAVSAGRKIPRDRVRDLIDRGPYAALAAKEAGLVDELFYWDEFEEWVKGTSTDEPAIVDASELRRTASGARKPGLTGDAIAVVYATGQILSGESQSSGFGGEVLGSDTIAEALRDASEDDDVKAIVIRIDSPGGSVLASDVIWREVIRAKANKPVIASMGDMAASGGYYIAMGATSIVAQPGTITGSIGIFTGKFVTKGLYGKIGLTTDGMKRGDYADMYSSTRPFSDAERRKLTAELTDAYQVFVRKVADGRGLDEETVDRVARGRVWLGSAGKELGLVDELGGLEKAIEIAMQKGNVRGRPGIKVFPRRKSLLETLSEGQGFVSARASDLPETARRALESSERLSRLDTAAPLALYPYRLTIR